MPKTTDQVSFSVQDLLDIQKEYANTSPSNEDVIDIPVDGQDGVVRTYEYNNGKWDFLGTFKNGEKVIEHVKKSTKKAKSVVCKTPLADELESDMSNEIQVTNNKEQDDKPETLTTSPPNPPVVAIASKENTKSGRIRKPRNVITLSVVMSALQDGKIEDAKKNLAKFIEKNGVEGKVKRQRKTDEDGNTLPKKVTEFNKFFSIELKRIATIENEKVTNGEITEAQKMAPNERMRLVSKLWKEHKANS